MCSFCNGPREACGSDCPYNIRKKEIASGAEASVLPISFHIVDAADRALELGQSGRGEYGGNREHYIELIRSMSRSEPAVAFQQLQRVYEGVEDKGGKNVTLRAMVKGCGQAGADFVAREIERIPPDAIQPDRNPMKDRDPRAEMLFIIAEGGAEHGLAVIEKYFDGLDDRKKFIMLRTLAASADRDAVRKYIVQKFPTIKDKWSIQQLMYGIAQMEDKTFIPGLLRELYDAAADRTAKDSVLNAAATHGWKDLLDLLKVHVGEVQDSTIRESVEKEIARQETLGGREG